MTRSKQGALIIVGINCLLLTFVLIQALREDSWLWRLLALAGAAAMASLTGIVIWAHFLQGGERQRRN